MRQTLDYDSDRPRGGSRRTVRNVVACSLGIILLLLAGFFAFIAYEFSQMSRIDLYVANKSASPVSADIAGQVAVNLVGQDQSASDSKVVGHSVVPAPVTVTVGSVIYQADAGFLLDDDGPHRFGVHVSADGTVVVTRQSNEGPRQLRMQPAP